MAGVKLFAVTTRGLEAVAAAEMAELPGVAVQAVAYRRVQAAYNGPRHSLPALLALRTVDDLFLQLAVWEGVDRPRAALARLTSLAAGLDLEAAVAVRRAVGPVSRDPAFAVTASFVGKRNYSSDEIKLAVAQGVQTTFPAWRYQVDDEASEVNLRLFIEHATAWVGMRLGPAPLHRRAFKQTHIPGSLKPPVAAALLRLAQLRPGMTLLDPCCGAGTILVEAAQMGARVTGSDIDPAARTAAAANLAAAGVRLPVQPWDVQRLPPADGAFDRIVTNLPWGRQVEVAHDLAEFYRQACAELGRVLAAAGQAVILTNVPDLVELPGRRRVQTLEISLFGQTPSVLVYGAG